MNREPQPPQVKEFKRKIEFYPFQVIGLPLLFLIPILALFGVLSETMAESRTSGNGLEVEVRYANHLNFQGMAKTEISVSNATNTIIPTLTVTIEKAFLDNFSNITFTLPIHEITEDTYVIEISDLRPNESRVVSYESRGSTIGSHHGTVRVSDGTSEISLSIDTFIFP